MHLKTKEFKEIEELIKAYQFAKENELTLDNILKAHEILAKFYFAEKGKRKNQKSESGH